MIIKKNRFVRDTTWTFLGMCIVGGAGLILNTIINKGYSIEALGVYSQITAYYVLYAAIACMGFETSTLKYISENIDDENSKSEILASSISLVIASSILLILILKVFDILEIQIYSSDSVHDGVNMILYAVPLFSVNKLFISSLNACRQMKAYALARSSRWIVICISTVLYVFMGYELKYCIYPYIIAELILVVYFAFIRYKLKFSIKNYWKWTKLHLVYGWFGLFMRIINEMNNNVMVLISGYFLTLKETGTIAFLMAFCKSINMVSSSIQTNFNPIFVQLYKERRIEHIKEKLISIYRVTNPVSIPLYLLSLIAYYGYIRITQMDGMGDSMMMYATTALGATICFIFQWNSSMLILAGFFKHEILRILVVTISKIALTLSLTMTWGIWGNVISYLLVELISVCVSFYLSWQSIQINILKLFYLACKKQI